MRRRSARVVAPPISYALSYPHVGFTGLVHIRIQTFMALVEDLCASFASIGFKRIIFLNGHYDNTYAIAYACADAAERMPRDVQAFPLNYWDALTEAEIAEFSGLKNGLHANLAETSAVLAINPDLVDMDQANAEFPPFPEFTVPTGPVHAAFFFTNPGSVHCGDEERHVGRRARLQCRGGRALHRGGRPLHAGRARQHRPDVRRRCRAAAPEPANPSNPSNQNLSNRPNRSNPASS